VVAPGESSTPPRFTPATAAARSPRRAPTIELGVDGPIARDDIRPLCERARGLLESGPARRLICDVGAVAAPDAVTIDALARLQLTARRLGREMALQHASGELRELLDFVGLSGAIRLSEPSRLEARRQAEEREERRRVQEERDPADPIA
jgi:ABC-type transporter Mla MlaB component